SVPFPNGLNVYSGLTQLVYVAAPAWPRVTDGSAAAVIRCIQLEQRPSVATAHGHYVAGSADLRLYDQNHRRSPTTKINSAIVPAVGGEGPSRSASFRRWYSVVRNSG